MLESDRVLRSLRALAFVLAVGAMLPRAVAGERANLPGVAFEPGKLRLPLTVRESSGIDRPGVVLTSGVPFPRGFLRDASGLRVIDSAGRVLPCQALPLSRWWRPTYDDSIRWALVSFCADLPAAGTETYFLTDSGGAAPDTALSVTESKTEFLVRTGSAEFTVSKDGSAILASAKVAGTALLGRNGLRALLTSGDWKEKGLYAGLEHTGCVRGARIEEEGPVRVVIYLEGTHLPPSAFELGTSSDGLYDYETRLYFTAGSSAVRVVHTLKNSRLARNLYVWPFLDYSLRLDLAPGSGTRVHVLREGGEVTQADGSRITKIYQDSSGGEQWREFGKRLKSYARWLSKYTKGERVRGVTFRGYKVTIGGEEEATGDHAPGAAAVSGERGGVSVVFRDFWQQYPKVLAASEDHVRIGLWPGEFDDVFFLDTGQRKSFDILIQFHAAQAASADLEKLRAHHDRTILFRAPPAWYVRSGAWDAGLALLDAPKSAVSRVWDKQSLDGVKVGWDWYGWITGWNSAGRHWNQNTQFARWLLFGDEASFDEAESRTLWAADLTPIHYDDPDFSRFWLMLRGWNLRENRITKHTFPGYYRRAVWGAPDNGHMGMLIWPEYYYLTGDARARKAIESLGVRARAYLWQYNHDDRADGRGPLPRPINWCQRRNPEDPEFRLHSRYIAWPLYDLVQWYQLTGERDFLPECRRIAHAFRNTGRWSPTGFLTLQVNEAGSGEQYGQQTHHGKKPPTDSASQCYAHFQTGIMASSLVGYYRETLDEEALDTLVGFADFLCHHAMMRDEAGKALGWTYAFGDYWGPYSPAEITTGRGPEFMSANFRVLQPLGQIYQLTGRVDYRVVCEAAVGSLRRPATDVISAHGAVLHPHEDRVPPAAVADLVARTSGKGDVTLLWTAPGDDGTKGTARRYQVKYARAPIVERVRGWPDRTRPLPRTVKEWEARVRGFQTRQVAFWQAFNCSGEPLPGEPGTRESFTLRRLPPGRYWFALKSFDDGPNMSPVSNVVAVTLE